MAEVPRIYSDQSAPEESLSFYALAEAYGTRQGDTMLSLTSHGGGASDDFRAPRCERREGRCHTYTY